MIRFSYRLLFLFFVSLGCIHVVGSSYADTRMQEPQDLEKIVLKVIRSGNSSILFNVEVADSARERAIGMMFRKDVKKQSGMLFLFQDNKERFFWMKNTFVSLDILFLDTRGVIQHIHEHAVPRSVARIPSNGSSVAVLEIGAGEAERLNIDVGDRVIYPEFFKVEE